MDPKVLAEIRTIEAKKILLIRVYGITDAQFLSRTFTQVEQWPDPVKDVLNI